ncbi:ABC transporter ATP-binding protein [Parapedobacter koreensis]|uniref:ATP-binding cassette, subfamily B, MsbA n=1 Tax=Parapedobacter koreensis TaxID=332977 RepID=A0A1H7PG52_9SPHI|nr:ABC transporter ATP-binding protein [Parapedobacter koreensis]SEL34037.1 ATP-binding cassette, subfamily B, MsbA [Parapedobacter koreensis]
MGKIKSILKNSFRPFVYFYSYLGYRIFLSMLISITVGVLDSFGLAMFMPMFQLIDSKEALDSADFGNFSFLMRGLTSLGIELNLKSILVVMASFFLMKGVVLYINQAYKTVIKEQFIRKVRLRLTTDLSQLSFKHFVSSDVGKIQNTTTGEVNKLSDAYAAYFEAIQQIILICVYLGLAFYVDLRFALLITAGGILTNFLFTRIFKTTKSLSKQVTSTSHAYQGLIIQFSANFKYLKATGTYNRMMALLKKAIQTIERDNLIMGKLHAFIGAAREPVLILVLCLVIYLHVYLFDGVLGTIILSLLFFYRALTSLVQMQSSYNQFLSLSGSVDNIISFEGELNENKENRHGMPFDSFKHSLSLSHIKFGYSNQPIIKDVSLTINRNETIAFVGESGSGKTTLINLITGLLSPDEGQITVDGNKMDNIDVASYRKRIGYIAQEPAIFNDTIFNNITLWDAPTEENRTKFAEVIRQASLHQFIAGLPLQEQTLLGNNGINISGGQKQRISIARELYKDIDLLVLDEATSSLDSEIEKNIQESIDLLKGSITILIVAHRLATIKNADKIVLLDQGQIINVSNSFADLESSSEKFKRMIELQKL